MRRDLAVVARCPCHGGRYIVMQYLSTVADAVSPAGSRSAFTTFNHYPSVDGDVERRWGRSILRARRCASAALVPCLSVCLSVCVSVARGWSIETFGGIDLVFGRGLLLTLPTLCYRGNTGIYKIRVFPPELSLWSICVWNSGDRKLCHGTSIVVDWQRWTLRAW